MGTIAERIIEIVDLNGGNMSAFARKINVTPAYISKLKNDPTRIPSDRTISDICREYGINENWLRYGTGPMYSQSSREREIEELMSSTLNGSTDFKKRVVQAICSRSEEELELLEKLLWDIVYNLQDAKKAQADSQPGRIIKIAGRDGSLEEQTLTDEDANEYLNRIDQLPDAGDDL